jgi:tight adherence protein B
MSELFWLGVGVFVATVCVLEGIAFLLRPRWDPEQRIVRRRIAKIVVSESELDAAEGVDITRKHRPLSDVPWLHSVLSRIPGIYQLNQLVVQSGTTHSLGVFVLAAAVIVLGTLFLLSTIFGGFLFPLLVGLIAGCSPIGYLYFKKEKRLRKFERQLPEALDLMARSLRAGHAFAGGIQMVAQEFEDPIGTEFERVLNEVNFGASVEQALKNLVQRTACPDVKFFTVAVIVQRESGGNLAEILETIARLIRERFKLRGRITALSAEGKLSAGILAGLPFCIALALSLMNPQYLSVLLSDPIGKFLMVVALCMMALGVYVMRRIIDIRV